MNSGLDVYDQIMDTNAMAFRHDIRLTHLHSCSGKSSDIYCTVVRACALCEAYGHESFHFGADGLGAGVRGDIRRINEDRCAASRPEIRDAPFRGTGEVWKSTLRARWPID